ncbi:YcaO-like family protein [Enterococcus faecium]|uniref:YcaO-like family protein n=4 Tax=Enterococcus faecium TaxID=1352 RepID=UPI001D175E67|nr:YcaO-like family protein [Enterococcus faecium]MCC4054119.1 YcaO-like family protein [Enterococcus faecium]
MNGFLLNDSRIFSKKGLFLNHHFNNYIVREDKQYVQAYEVGFDKRSSNLKKVFGEFFEREVLINTNDSSEKFTHVNYLSKNMPKSMPKGIFLSSDRFVDSNGMASHTDSNSVIRTAFFEFFERQSFIVNYLTKTSVPKISINNFTEIKSVDNYLKNYVDIINYFNVSLSDKIYVVLCIGYSKLSKCIGLGTSNILEVAIKKSQIEALQYFATDFSKNNKSHIFVDFNDSKKDLYHSRFNQLTTNEFYGNYSYLLKNTEYYRFENEPIFNFKLWKKECREKLKMDPVIGVFPSYQPIPHLKVVKVIDENWFPHMNPVLYNKNVYTFIQSIYGKELDKSIEYIPFP